MSATEGNLSQRTEQRGGILIVAVLVMAVLSVVGLVFSMMDQPEGALI